LIGDEAMENDRLIIQPKRPKGEDGYRTFSVRIKEELVSRLEEIAAKSGHSRNELIALLLEYGLDHCEIGEK